MLMDFFFLQTLSDHTQSGYKQAVSYQDGLWYQKWVLHKVVLSGVILAPLHVDFCFTYLPIACMASPSYSPSYNSLPLLFQVLSSVFLAPFRFSFSLHLPSPSLPSLPLLSFCFSPPSPLSSVSAQSNLTFCQLASASLWSILISTEFWILVPDINTVFISQGFSLHYPHFLSPLWEGKSGHLTFLPLPKLCRVSPTPMTSPEPTLEFEVSSKASAYLQWARSCPKAGQTEQMSKGSGEVAHLFPLLPLRGLQTGQK